MTGLGMALLLAACSDEFTAAPEQPSLAVGLTATASSGDRTSRNLWLSDTTLFIGDTATVLLRETDRFSAGGRGRRSVTFRSRDEDVAMVGSRSGRVVAVGVGTTRIVMRTSSGFRDSLTVTITPLASTVAPVAPVAPVESIDPPAITAPVAPPTGIVLPTLPQATVSTAEPLVTGRRWNVPAGDMAALQNAVNNAAAGDEIVLPNNAEYVGSLALSRHAGTGVVTLRSETVPTRGVRVSPSTAASLARIVTVDSRPAIGTVAGARGWRIIGVQALQRNDNIMNYGIVRLGSGSEATASEFVSDIVLDRVYVSAGLRGSTRRCVGINGSGLAVIHSWLAECHARGLDAQAIAGWTGSGPFLIENNHMEASSEHVVFGGADPKITNMSPSDITIRGNYMFRPLSWRNSGWLIKNIFELKHAKRVLFESNVLENNWIDGQVGYAILFQALTQDGAAPWSTIQDVTVRNNVIRNSTSGVHILSRRESGGATPVEPSKRILFSNNLFADVGRDPLSGTNGRILQLLGDVEDLSFVSNTFHGGLPTDAVMFAETPQLRTALINNVFQASMYGLMGSAVGEGSSALTAFNRAGITRGNVFTGRLERIYPAGNSFPTSLGPDAFVNSAAGDYTLRSTLPFAFSGGTRVGVDGRALLSATAGVVDRP
jgi:hypothetical protein